MVRSQQLELGKEYPGPDEAAQAEEIAKLFTGMSERKYPPGVRPMRRDAHTKAHGLVKAEFSVLPGVPPEQAAHGSPFVPVARIQIPRQVFDTESQNEYAEHLSFTPWHSLPAHQPIGGVNRVRKLVYERASTLRHTHNEAPRHEPSSFADFDR